MLPADWSISPTPGTPLPFTNLRPFVPKSWVIGSILLPSCARLPHKETNTRQDACTVEKSLRLQNTNRVYSDHRHKTKGDVCLLGTALAML